MSANDQILVGELNNKIYISVEGRGHFQNSHPMKQFALAKLDEGKSDFLINLEHCTGMDSTFMGVLAGLALKLKKSSEKRLKVVQVSSHNKDLLETLGLNRLIDIVDSVEEQVPKTDSVEGASPDKKQVAEHMLEAHETLSELSDVNKVKFKNVIDFIKDDLGKNTE